MDGRGSARGMGNLLPYLFQFTTRDYLSISFNPILTMKLTRLFKYIKNHNRNTLEIHCPTSFYQETLLTFYL